MAKKKVEKASTDRHDPESLTIRLESAYRVALGEVTAVTRRSFATETRIALDKHLAEMREKIKAGHFKDGK